MIYYILTLALGALYWAMWSYTAHREIKTLRNDLVALQEALHKTENESNDLEERLDKSLRQKKEMERIVLDYDRASTGLVEWTKDNAFFKDNKGARSKYEAWEETVDFLGREYKNLL